MLELVLASGNGKKLTELRALLPDVRVRSQAEFGVGEAEEPFGKSPACFPSHRHGGPCG